MTAARVAFGPFELDPGDASLWRAGARLPVTPKCFELLTFLVGHAGRLVTKDELLEAVWPGTYVADGVLKVRMRELRALLGDDATEPRFIATVHRRGYRFIAEVRTGGTSDGVVATVAPAMVVPEPAPGDLIGRDDQLRELGRRFALAATGRRQIVFVAGDAGIGKTSLVDAFTAALPPDALVARGQCLEHYGSGEAYLPLLDALGELTRGANAPGIAAALRRHAPSWLAQLPWLVEAADRELLQREMLGLTRERMLREIAVALEALAAERPLVLVLEDVHWSDPSTVDVLSQVAHRRSPARLLVVATYRPVDVILSSHPVKALVRRLGQQRLCTELRVPLFDREQVTRYLERRLDTAALPAGLVDAILERTGGTPLFVAGLVDHMIDRGWLAGTGDGFRLTVTPSAIAAEIPEGVREMIEQQIEALGPDETRALEAASIAGEEFAAAAVAAALDVPVEEVEALLRAELRRGRFLRSVGASDVGQSGLSERYSFAHALHRDVFYRALPASRRVELHRRIGEWQEQVGASPAELASHFLAAAGEGRAREAVAYAVRAAERARGVLAYAEAARHYQMALRALELQPGDDRGERCRLLLALGQAQERSGAIGRATETFAEAAEQARELGSAELLAQAALGMGRGHHVVARADERIVALLEEALARLDGGDSPLRACVLARLDAALSPIPEAHERRDAMARDALAMARRLGDPDTILAVHQFTRWAFSGRDSADELRRSAAEFGTLAARARSKEQALQFQLLRIADLHELGEVAEAAVALDALAADADDAGIPWFRWFTLRLRTMRALQDGRLDDAERLAGEAFAFGQQMDHPNVRPVHAAQLLHLSFLRGQHEEAASRLERYVEQNPQQHSLRAELARLRLHQGREDDARRALDDAGRRGFADVPRDSMWLVCLAGWAEVAGRVGAKRHARTLHGLFAPFAGRVLGVGPSVASLGHGTRYLGLLADALGRRDEADRLLAVAASEHERMGARPWLALAWCDQARALARRNDAAARGRADELRARGCGIAREVGMSWLAQAAGEPAG